MIYSHTNIYDLLRDIYRERETLKLCVSYDEKTYNVLETTWKTLLKYFLYTHTHSCNKECNRREQERKWRSILWKDWWILIPLFNWSTQQLWNILIPLWEGYWRMYLRIAQSPPEHVILNYTQLYFMSAAQSSQKGKDLSRTKTKKIHIAI